MDALILKQEELSERINKDLTNYRNAPKEKLTVPYIEIRTDMLETSWNKFVSNHYQLVCTVEKSARPNVSYFSEDMYGRCQEVHLDYKVQLITDLISRRPFTSGPSYTGNAISEVKLPDIQLPTFSGRYEEWESFQDLFLSLIHNNASLSAVQKLYYLKGCLSGEAETLLRNLSTTDSNYEDAWSQLVARFSNKRYNCNEIVKRLFAQKSLSTESASGVRQLLDTTLACIKSLQNLDIKTESWDIIINFLVASKLDAESRKLWEHHVSQIQLNSLPTWDQFKQFLEMRFRTLEMLEGCKKSVVSHKSFHLTVTKVACTFCSGQHLMYQCKQFGKRTPDQRLEFVQSKGLCFNCLSPTHPVKNCRQLTCCRRCGKRHHSLLHFQKVTQNPNLSTVSASSGNVSSHKVVAHFTQESHHIPVLLPTALIKIKSGNGCSRIVRALIDQGSEASFVKESIAQSLDLERKSINRVISGLGEEESKSKAVVSFNLESMYNSKYSIPVHALTLRTLTSLPSKATSNLDWPEIEKLHLADPTYGSVGDIDAILGVEVYSDIILPGHLKRSNKNVIAQNTQLGWILSGKVKDEFNKAEIT